MTRFDFQGTALTKSTAEQSSNTNSRFHCYALAKDGSRRIVGAATLAGNPDPHSWPLLRDRFLDQYPGYEVLVWDRPSTSEYAALEGEYLPYQGPFSVDGESSGGEFLDPVDAPVNVMPWATHYKGHLAMLAHQFLGDFNFLDYDLAHTDQTVRHDHELSAEGITRNHTFLGWFRRRIAFGFYKLDEWSKLAHTDEKWKRQLPAMRAEFDLWCNVCDGRAWVHDVLFGHPHESWRRSVDSGLTFDINPKTFAYAASISREELAPMGSFLTKWQELLKYYRDTPVLTYPQDLNLFADPAFPPETNSKLATVAFSRPQSFTFNPGTLLYNVATTDERLTVTVTTESPYATVGISHRNASGTTVVNGLSRQVTMTPGVSVLAITVTAEDTVSTRLYVLRFTKT